MAYISRLTDLDGQSYDIKAKKTQAIPFGRVDGTSTSTAFTATVDGITELYDGVVVYLRNDVVTSAANFTININDLGAKPVYSSMADATRLTTQFNVNYTMMFIYNSTRVSDGCWDMYYGYDSNTNTIGYLLRTNYSTRKVTDQTGRYRLLFSSADDSQWVPANTSNNTDATSLETVNQRPINPFGDICYYSYTTVIAAGNTVGVGYQWSQYQLVLGYSFNRKGSALTLTYPDSVYVKCAPQADGSAIIDATTPYVQALPSSEDGKIYIYLGKAYSATNIELAINHPVYEYKGGAIRQFTNAADASVTVTPIQTSGTEIAQINGTSIYSPVTEIDVTANRRAGKSIATVDGVDILAYDELVISLGSITGVTVGTAKQISLDSTEHYTNILAGLLGKSDIKLTMTITTTGNEQLICTLPYIDKVNGESSPMYVFGGVTTSMPSYYPVSVFVGIIGAGATLLATKLSTPADLESLQMEFNSALLTKLDSNLTLYCDDITLCNSASYGSYSYITNINSYVNHYVTITRRVPVVTPFATQYVYSTIIGFLTEQYPFDGSLYSIDEYTIFYNGSYYYLVPNVKKQYTISLETITEKTLDDWSDGILLSSLSSSEQKAIAIAWEMRANSMLPDLVFRLNYSGNIGANDKYITARYQNDDTINSYNSLIYKFGFVSEVDGDREYATGYLIVQDPNYTNAKMYIVWPPNLYNEVDSLGVSLSHKQDVSNLVTSVSSSSTDAQYPSAKLFYDTIGNVESLLAAI